MKPEKTFFLDFQKKKMLLSLLSSLWIRHSLHGVPVYSETSHAVGISGWSVDLRVSNEALTVLGYILALFMAVGGKYGVLDYVVAVFMGMPAYTDGVPLLTIKRAGETRLALTAQHVEYGCLFLVSRYRSLVWLGFYVGLHTLLVHPTLVNEAKALGSFYLKKPYKQEDETSTVVHEVELKVEDEKTE